MRIATVTLISVIVAQIAFQGKTKADITNLDSLTGGPGLPDFMKPKATPKKETPQSSEPTAPSGIVTANPLIEKYRTMAAEAEQFTSALGNRSALEGYLSSCKECEFRKEAMVHIQQLKEKALDILRYSMDCPFKGRTEVYDEPVREAGTNRRLIELQFIGDSDTFNFELKSEDRRHIDVFGKNLVKVSRSKEVYFGKFSNLGFVVSEPSSEGAALLVECLGGKCLKRTYEGEFNNSSLEADVEVPFCDARTAENARIALQTLRGPLKLSFWDHNGSLVKLIEEGVARRFYYERPSEPMAAVVSKGDLLFEGRDEGTHYSGEATLFKSGCPELKYHVEGNVSVNACHATITMSGKAPRRGSNCEPTGGYHDDVLTFVLQPGGDCRK